MNRVRGLIMAFALAFACATVTKPTLATTIYSDDFNGSGSTPLNGQAPDVRPGSETWTASNLWQANGVGGPTTRAQNSANSFLPFVPENGNLYRLSATLAQPTTTESATTSWAGLGFTASDDTATTLWNGPNNASPWILYRVNGQVVTFFGSPSTPGSSEIEGTFSGVQTLAIELDTRPSAWTAEWFVGGTSVRSYTFPSNPTVTNVGFGLTEGLNLNVAGDFDEFSLVIVPEPSSLATLSAGGGGLVVLWRRRGRRPSR
jgi:hypothetical protein